MLQYHRMSDSACLQRHKSIPHVFLADRFGVFNDTVFGHVRRRQDQQRLHVQNNARHAGHG